MEISLSFLFKIATAYTLTGDEITVTNLHSDSYVDDIADFVSFDTTTEVELLGKGNILCYLF